MNMEQEHLLLSPRDTAVMRLFHLPAANVALLNPALPIVRDPGRPCPEIAHQLL